MASRNAERREPVTRGTGNVFADLGFPDAAERQAKLRLAYALNQLIAQRSPRCLHFVTTTWRALLSNA